jgi:hypothetical protein
MRLWERWGRFGGSGGGHREGQGGPVEGRGGCGLGGEGPRKFGESMWKVKGALRRLG